MDRRSRTIVLAAAALAFTACPEPADDRDAAQRSPGEADRVIVAERGRGPEPPREPDDTGRNLRDAGGATLTPQDQANVEAELEIVRRIRQGITSNESMSLNARNAKIIVRGGVVTLRGPVHGEQEKLAIEAIARQTPGVSRVDNQLEVDPDVDVETEFEDEYEEER